MLRVEMDLRESSSAASVFTIVPVTPDPVRSSEMVLGVDVKFIATTMAGPEPVERI